MAFSVLVLSQSVFLKSIFSTADPKLQKLAPPHCLLKHKCALINSGFHGDDKGAVPMLCWALIPSWTISFHPQLIHYSFAVRKWLQPKCFRGPKGWHCLKGGGSTLQVRKVNSRTSAATSHDTLVLSLQAHLLQCKQKFSAKHQWATLQILSWLRGQWGQVPSRIASL